MFRTTRHKTLHVPHRLALAAGLLALASWSWTSQTLHDTGNALAAQEEIASATVKEGSKALLDMGILLLLRSGDR